MKDAFLIFLIALACYLLTAGGHLYSPDEEIVYRMTASLYEDGDLAIEPLGGFATQRSEEGKEYAQYGVGQPVLSVPFYAIGKAIAPMASVETWKRIYGIAPDEPEGARGYAYTAEAISTRFMLSFVNIFVSALLAAYVYLIAFELTRERRASFFASLLYALGSYAWAHSRPYYTEILAVLFIFLAWYALLRALRGRMTPWVLLAGAATGFAALVRMDSVLMYPGLAMMLLGPILRSENQPRLHPYITFCIPAIACGIALLVLNAIHFGGPFATGYSDQPEGVKFSTPVLAGLYGFLFSAGKGLFFFSPVLVLGLLGWKPLIARDRFIAAGIALSIVLPLLVMSKWQNWAGGWCWGPRHIFMIHPFLAIPIAFWFAEGWNPVQRVVAFSLLAIGIGVQLLGSSQDYMEYYRLYYRSPRIANRVLYDSFDVQHWSQYYQLLINHPEEGWKPADLRYTPAPTQHSIYIPQSSMWSGYPRMWSELKMIDNLWLRILK